MLWYWQINITFQFHDKDSSKKSEEKSKKNKDNYGTHSGAYYGNQADHQGHKGSIYHDNHYAVPHYGHRIAHNQHHNGKPYWGWAVLH